jgi:hypothetical protein
MDLEAFHVVAAGMEVVCIIIFNHEHEEHEGVILLKLFSGL